MTATLTAPNPSPTVAAPRRGASPAVAPARFGNLLRVELRKLLNTRAGRWLILIALLLSAGATALVIGFFEPETLSDVFLFAFVPLGMIVPIIAILAATSEGSQRTGLTTFALEPRRWRVAAAKLAASQLAAVAIMAAATAITYAGAGLAALGGHEWGSWSLTAGTAGGVALNQALLMLQASAVGFLLLNTPGAVVVFLLVPQLWTNVVTFVPWLAERAHWFDLNQAASPLVSTTTEMTAQGWLHIASAAGIWVFLPLAAGIIRFLRAEVK